MWPKNQQPAQKLRKASSPGGGGGGGGEWGVLGVQGCGAAASVQGGRAAAAAVPRTRTLGLGDLSQGLSNSIGAGSKLVHLHAAAAQRGGAEGGRAVGGWLGGRRGARHCRRERPLHTAPPQMRGQAIVLRQAAAHARADLEHAAAARGGGGGEHGGQSQAQVRGHAASQPAPPVSHTRNPRAHPMGPFHSTVLQSPSAAWIMVMDSGPTSRPWRKGGKEERHPG